MAITAGTDMVTLKGRTDVGHIPAQPVWLFGVRCLQFVLAVVILALSAWAGAGNNFYYSGFGVGIFSFVWTLLFILYIEVSTFFLPQFYNKYVHLVLECLAVVFWLSAFAALAVVAAAWSVIDTVVCSGYFCYRSLEERTVSQELRNYINATKAAAALGAILWVLFIGTLISYGIYFHRHRRAVRDAQIGVAPVVQQDIKLQPMVNQYPVEQQVPYQQQPYQPQQQQPYQPQPQQPYQPQPQPPYQAQSMA